MDKFCEEIISCPTMENNYVSIFSVTILDKYDIMKKTWTERSGVMWIFWQDLIQHNTKL